MFFGNSFFFLRHGETEWNKERRVQGQLDAPLNATGKQQAQKAAEILKKSPITEIVASPLSRARDTAQAVAEYHQVPLHFDDDLMECHLGVHEGGYERDWMPDYWRGIYDPPGGETFQQFSERVLTAMHRITTRGENILIVAHGGLWIAANHHFTITPSLLPMPNALPLYVHPEDDKWQVETLGAK